MSKKAQCPKNIHIRAVAAQIRIFFQENILLNIECIIQTVFVHFHLYSLIKLYKDAIQVRNLYLRSLTKYCPNANNQLQKWLLLNKEAKLSSNHTSEFKGIEFCM